jgi:hypothetical protein
MAILRAVTGKTLADLWCGSINAGHMLWIADALGTVDIHTATRVKVALARKALEHASSWRDDLEVLLDVAEAWASDCADDDDYELYAADERCKGLYDEVSSEERDADENIERYGAARHAQLEAALAVTTAVSQVFWLKGSMCDVAASAAKAAELSCVRADPRAREATYAQAMNVLSSCARELITVDMLIGHAEAAE